MMLGVHCSVSGGLENSFSEAETLKTDVMQIFTRNQRQWKAKPVSDEEKKVFTGAFKKSKIKTAFSHCSYLINLAAENEDIRKKSIAALKDEVERCNQLGLAYCVLHPGAAGTQDVDTAISKIADALNIILDEDPSGKTIILLENTAGQGTSVGGTLENLKQIREQVLSQRIGYCFDTCHAYAAGFDIRTSSGCDDMFAKFDKILGIKNLRAFHLNDSKGELGSHLDRHENIGHGKLGKEPFRYIMNKFSTVPKVIETPKEDDWDEKNLKLLRSFIN
jgi:deoxyribonuclease IV